MSDAVNAEAARRGEALRVVRDIDAGMTPKIIGAPPESTPTILPPDTSREARRIIESNPTTRDGQIQKAVAQTTGVVIPFRNIRNAPKIDLTQAVNTGDVFQSEQILRSAGGLSGAKLAAADTGETKIPWLAIIGVAAVAYFIGKSSNSNAPLLADIGEGDEDDEE